MLSMNMKEEMHVLFNINLSWKSLVAQSKNNYRRINRIVAFVLIVSS